jgi:NADH:ubiquinone oxidoreductase subunit E
MVANRNGLMMCGSTSCVAKGNDDASQVGMRILLISDKQYTEDTEAINGCWQ